MILFLDYHYVFYEGSIRAQTSANHD